jgi:Zn-dependent M28 family amino/carboxypeptidase
VKTVALLAALSGACLSAPSAAPLAFDGARAFEHIRQLVAIGPRVAGTPGAMAAREYIRNQLTALKVPVEEQSFQAATPIGPAQMVNLRAMLPGDASKGRLIIAGHYDTKRFEDITFVGANDGGSSTAFLIELARVLTTRNNPRQIELLFLDGEEAVIEWEGDDNTYGSRHYVETARKAGTLKDIRALVLIDMIGDRDLRIKRETQSTPWLTDIIWRAARELKRREFLDEGTPINDDHLPFLEAGVPAVDVIDLDYPWWHTAGDTLDKVSPESLKVVGDVLLHALPAIERRVFETSR